MGGGDACVAHRSWRNSYALRTSGRRKRPHPTTSTTPAPTDNSRYFLKEHQSRVRAGSVNMATTRIAMLTFTLLDTLGCSLPYSTSSSSMHFSMVCAVGKKAVSSGAL